MVTVICISSCLVRIDVASIKHYLSVIKAKQSALSARKPLVGGREPQLCSRPFGLELRPFKPCAYGDMLSNLTTAHCGLVSPDCKK